MKPVLFSPTETSFSTNGIGILSDAISCRSIQELNGQYELELKYPITGLHFSDIQQRSLVLAKVDPVSELQPFRVYQITKPSSGIVTVRARHLAYDLGGIPVSPFAAQSAPLALSGLSANAVTDCPFTFSTDKSTAAAFTVTVPSAIWSLLGSSKGGVLDTYGGEYEFDRYDVKLWNRRGADRGVSIRYGKNLTSLEQDENCANCFTGVYPYWTNTDGQLVQLPERVVNAPGTHSYSKVLPLDLSTEWQEAPTEDQLRARTEQYITDNDIGKPAVRWKVEFVQLEQTEEYKGKALLERVLLGDTVSVEFEQLGVSPSARVVAVDYDSVLERYNNVTLGSVKANISNTIAQQNKEIAKKPGKSEMQIAIEQLTNTILGAAGGSVRLLDTDGDKVPDTLYIADNPDPAQAIKVWRFNYEGWGASENGYNGPFIMGATFEDGFIADFIKAGTLDATLIKVINLVAERLQSIKDDSTLDIDGAMVNLYQGVHLTVSINNSYDGSPQVELMEYENGEVTHMTTLNPAALRLGGTGAGALVLGVSRSTKKAYLILDGEDPNSSMKTLRWKDNGDGTSTLIGT